MKLSMFMLILLCICAAILTSLLAFSQFRADNSQRDEREQLIRKTEELQATINDLREEQGRLSEKIRQQAATDDVSTELSATNNVSTNTSQSLYQQPFFAKAYLDGDFVGLAKISPVYRTDEETGNTVFENIVLLSADARAAITKTVTNVVEREVVRNNTLNNNYTARPYVYTYPVWVRPSSYPTNTYPPRRSTPTPPNTMIPPPRNASPITGGGNWPQWKNGGVWKPETIRKSPVVGSP